MLILESAQFLMETVLNSIQFGIFLFLVAAGLTLVFGIMNMVNLAHGSLFMMGAYFASYFFRVTDNFLLAIIIALPLSLLLGIALEYLAFRTLYDRDHLDQVLATFGCILFFNQLVLVVFGAESQEYRLSNAIDFPLKLSINWLVGAGTVVASVGGFLMLRSLGLFSDGAGSGALNLVRLRTSLPRMLSAGLLVLLAIVLLAFFEAGLGTGIVLLALALFVGIATTTLWALFLLVAGAACAVILVYNLVTGSGLAFDYPSYRLYVILAGLTVAVLLYLLITRTRAGMHIRAGASNRPMIGALGVNITLLFTLVFGLGAALAGFAGIMIGPIESVEAGMGEEKLILAFVVIVIGGIGSIRGAFIASIIVGLVEIFGRSSMTGLVQIFLEKVAEMDPVALEEFANTAGPALASMAIYILMAAVLFFKPQGLFPGRTG